MGFSTIFTTLLFVVLIYLHVKQNSVIFQHDIKVAKILAMILLCILIIRSHPKTLLRSMMTQPS